MHSVLLSDRQAVVDARLLAEEGEVESVKIGPRTAKEILESYAEFHGDIEHLQQRLEAAYRDRKQQADIGPLLAELGGRQNNKTLETLVEIAAQLAELNRQLATRVTLEKVPTS